MGNACPYCGADDFQLGGHYVAAGDWRGRCNGCGKWSGYDEAKGETYALDLAEQELCEATDQAILDPAAPGDG